MFGKIKSDETLNKLRKKIYVYDALSKELLEISPSFILTAKNYKMGKDTLTKRLKDLKPHKNKIFSLEPIQFS